MADAAPDRPAGGVRRTSERHSMKRFLLPFAAACACAAVLAFSSGCESAESNDVVIHPGHAEVAKGGQVGLTATGWDNFRWSLSDTGLGTLSATVGRSVVYTATAAGEGVQHVTATAIGSGSSGSSSTNSVSNASVGFSATATITHK